MLKRMVCGIVVSTMVSAVAVQAVEFHPIGFLDSTNRWTDIHAISPDGQYVVGGSRNAAGVTTPYIWSESTGIQALSNPSGVNSWATGVGVRSGGEIVVSGSINGGARLWNSTTNTWNDFGASGASTANNALAVGANGDVYVGGLLAADKSDAWRGTATGDLSNPANYSYTHNPGTSNTTKLGINSMHRSGMWVGKDRDGGIDRGIYAAPGGTWSLLAPLQQSLDPMFWNYAAQAYSMSADGTTVVGLAYSADFSGYTAAKWTIGQPTAQDLGKLLPGHASPVGYAVSADGSVVVGRSFDPATGGQGDTAVFWDAQGIHDVKAVLEAAGQNLTGWQLGRVYTVSDDGLTMAGEGKWDHDGDPLTAPLTQAWVATVPEPATVSLLVLGGLMLARRRR